MTMTFYDCGIYLSLEYQNEVTDFLFEHLDEYGDSRDDIWKALQYALKDSDESGGFICTATENDQLIGVVVVNHTGMEGYIPENILVYIAIHREWPGKGRGRQILTEVIQHANGDIPLHVEPDNPARFLYQNLGFICKYMEMQLVGKEEF